MSRTSPPSMISSPGAAIAAWEIVAISTVEARSRAERREPEAEGSGVAPPMVMRMSACRAIGISDEKNRFQVITLCPVRTWRVNESNAQPQNYLSEVMSHFRT